MVPLGLRQPCDPEPVLLTLIAPADEAVELKV